MVYKIIISNGVNDTERTYSDLPKNREDIGKIIEEMVDILEEPFDAENIKYPKEVNNDDF